MGSESDEVVIEDSDESLLDIKEVFYLVYKLKPFYNIHSRSMIWNSIYRPLPHRL